MSFIFMFIKFLLFTSPINSCFDNFCRVTCHNTVGRYIFSHYRVCSYHRIIAYGYSFQNHGTVAYPYVVPDDNRLRRPVGNVFYIVTIIVPDDSFTCDMGVFADNDLLSSSDGNIFIDEATVQNKFARVCYPYIGILIHVKFTIYYQCRPFVHLEFGYIR